MKDEWWNYSTFKPSKIVSQRMSGAWHHDMPQHSAEPIPHTRPWPPRRPCGCVPIWCSWRTRLSSAPRPRPGNRDRSRLASSSRALAFKSWSLKSGEHMTFNSDMWISLIQNLANNAEINSCLQHLHIRQLSLNRDEWWNYRTSKPSKLVTVKGYRKHMKQKHSAVGSTVKTWSLKSWEHLRTNICKYETITFNSNMWISLMRNLANNGNQPRNPHFHSEIHHLHVRRGLLDQPWMTKLQHLQTIQTCHCHRMPGQYGKVTSWHAAALGDSAEPIPHTRPWPPRHQCSSFLANQCLWRTRLSSVPRPRPGNGDRARLASSSRALAFKSWSLKSGDMTFNSDMWISLIQNLANNAEINSCLQHLHIRQLSLNRDEWWNYRTSKPSKLVTVKGYRKHMKTEAFSGRLYCQNLITEILRTSENKYMQIWNNYI